MSVKVDESGHERAATDINHLGTLDCQGTFDDLRDLPIFDRYRAIRQQARRPAIE